MWPKNRTRSVTWLRILMDVLALAVYLSPRQVWAGFIDLTSSGDFQRALTQGLLTPVVQWNDDLEFHYPGQQALFRPASLSVDPNGLVVDIGTPGDPPNVIG